MDSNETVVEQKKKLTTESDNRSFSLIPIEYASSKQNVI